MTFRLFSGEGDAKNKNEIKIQCIDLIRKGEKPIKKIRDSLGTGSSVEIKGQECTKKVARAPFFVHFPAISFVFMINMPTGSSHMGGKTAWGLIPRNVADWATRLKIKPPVPMIRSVFISISSMNGPVWYRIHPAFSTSRHISYQDFVFPLPILPRRSRPSDVWRGWR